MCSVGRVEQRSPTPSSTSHSKTDGMLKVLKVMYLRLCLWHEALQFVGTVYTFPIFSGHCATQESLDKQRSDN